MEQFWTTELLNFGNVSIHLGDLILIGTILLFTRIILWVSKRLIKKRIKTNRLDSGRSMAIFQIFKYILIVFAIIISLDVIGIKITLLLAGSAALLVGIGLGLQQLFNDLVSGIVLLIEGTVTVDDIVELDGIVGKIEEINLRTSQLMTRSEISIIVPNSKLVSDNVINWSHNRRLTRFDVNVGVAYGSDVSLVIKLIKEAASENSDVATDPEPIVIMKDFGESSLDFVLKYWSMKMWTIESVSSDLRIAIEEKFRANNVTIPFPQRDLHLKSNSTNNSLST